MRWWKSGDLKKTEFVSRLSEMNPAKWGSPVAHRSTSGSSGDACIQ